MYNIHTCNKSCKALLIPCMTYILYYFLLQPIINSFVFGTNALR